MTKFRIFYDTEEYIDIEADNFEISPAGIVLTKNIESLNPLDPVEKTAFSGYFKDIIGFYAVDDDGERIDLLR